MQHAEMMALPLERVYLWSHLMETVPSNVRKHRGFLTRSLHTAVRRTRESDVHRSALQGKEDEMNKFKPALASVTALAMIVGLGACGSSNSSSDSSSADGKITIKVQTSGPSMRRPIRMSRSKRPRPRLPMMRVQPSTPQFPSVPTPMTYTWPKLTGCLHCSPCPISSLI